MGHLSYVHVGRRYTYQAHLTCSYLASDQAEHQGPWASCWQLQPCLDWKICTNIYHTLHSISKAGFFLSVTIMHDKSQPLAPRGKIDPVREQQISLSLMGKHEK